MLEHAFHYVQSVMGGFCNLQDTSEIDYAIRKTALSISKEESEGIRNSYFDVYKTCLEIFEDDIERDYMLFFKVKIYTAIEKANKKYHEDFYKLKEEEAIEAYKEYISAIPKIDADGIFGPATEAAVRKFQLIFGLPVTGIVDYKTWYKISEIYVGVSRIAELN